MKGCFTGTVVDADECKTIISFTRDSYIKAENECKEYIKDNQLENKAYFVVEDTANKYV